MTNSESEFRPLLDFWFGELDDNGCASAELARRWWATDPRFDQQLRDTFGPLHQQIVAGGKEEWLRAPLGRLAYIIVCDQLSRNMFRGTPGMYASDARALAAVNEGLAVGHDVDLATDHRVFFYMPLMHSESLSDQERCIELFGKLADSRVGAVRDRLAGNLDFAIRHRDIVARFGRFPHRNQIMGRPSSPEELEFLKQPGSSF